MSGGQAHDGARPGPISERLPGPQGVTAPLPLAHGQVPAPTEMSDVSRRIAGAATASGAAATPAGHGGPPLAGSARRPGLSARQVLALQRSVGNRAVSTIMGQVAQRVTVKEAKKTETIYNSQGAGGQASANKYDMNPQYDMTRSGDSGVTVTVRIKFLSQVRNGIDPTAPGAPPGTPPLKTLIGSPIEIPASDPRRAWATGVATAGVAHWNGHLALVGEEWNLTTDNTKKRLPVTFASVPVFGIGEKADTHVKGKV